MIGESSRKLIRRTSDRESGVLESDMVVEPETGRGTGS